MLKDTIDGNHAADADLQLQIKVSRELAIGFVFSLIGLAGLGYFIALVIGISAKRVIDKAKTAVAGSGLAWWCIIVGDRHCCHAIAILPYLVLDLRPRNGD